MKPLTIKLAKSFIILGLFFLIFGWAPIEFGQEEAFFHGFLIKKPIIRIGLGVNISRVEVSSSSGMKIYEVNPGYKLVADNVAEAQIKGRREKLAEKFLIQVGQTKNREKAETLAENLNNIIDHKIFVTTDSEGEISGIYKVMIGDFMTRDDALNFIKKLSQLGIKDTWILREEITDEESKPLWILINDELKSLSEETILYFVPSHPQSHLFFNGRSYRGIFLLKSTPKGMVLINILNLEDYLKGVVPSELSPYTYDELEAHKAQAVAARTYALRHLGLNKDLGFDIDDTPRSQYYQGMGAEHSLSTKAVEMTRGEVARYKGKLISALYTSTCGGATENVENVFGGDSIPYLRSTPCIYEKQDEWLLKSKNAIPPIRFKRKNISPDIAFLISLKVIPLETNPLYYHQQASFEEGLEWTKNVLSLVGKKNDAFDPDPSPLNVVNFVRIVVDTFGWQNRIENLVMESERDFIMKGFENLPGEVKTQLAYCIKSGILPSAADIGDPERELLRGELALYLARILRSYEDIGKQGVFRGLKNNLLELQEEGEIKKYVLSPNFFLLMSGRSDSSMASHIYLLGGEDIKVFGEGEEIFLVEVKQPLPTNILDRSSSFHRWKKKVTRKALGKRINRYYPIGELVDVLPQKRGKSRRVIEVLIQGKESQAIVKGLRIRWVLGLRETLFVVDREYDQEGQISKFSFYGKGFGHGVGLCQVGAFGMALAGADYKDILKKYYHGIKISKDY